MLASCSRVGYHAAIRCTAILLMAAAACGRERPSPTVSSQPRAADRYARLLIAQLADTNPIPRQQEVLCEAGRLMERLGYNESQRRIAGVEDSVYGTAARRLKRDSIRARVVGRSYEVGGPVCDSLDAIADREQPIQRTSEAAPPRPKP